MDGLYKKISINEWERYIMDDRGVIMDISIIDRINNIKELKYSVIVYHSIDKKDNRYYPMSQMILGIPGRKKYYNDYIVVDMGEHTLVILSFKDEWFTIWHQDYRNNKYTYTILCDTIDGVEEYIKTECSINEWA